MFDNLRSNRISMLSLYHPDLHAVVLTANSSFIVDVILTIVIYAGSDQNQYKRVVDSDRVLLLVHIYILRASHVICASQNIAFGQ